MKLYFTMEVKQYVRCFIKSWQYIRIRIFKAGCKGLSYEFIAENIYRREDLVFCIDGVRILINQDSLSCSKDLKVKVRSFRIGSRLVVVRAGGSICSCGKSLGGYR